jgi:hypothetical protein
LGRDAFFGSKEARAWLVVAGLVTSKPELRKALRDFAGSENFVLDAEPLRGGDRATDEVGAAVNPRIGSAANNEPTDRREQ